MFKIRKYKSGDEKQILKLDRLVEEHPWNRRNIQNWYWKFKNAPYKSPSVYVCEYKKKLIGTFSTIPIRYYINGKEVCLSNSIAMIVHPKFQDKGIIKFIGDKLLNETKKKSDLVFGYPNTRSYELHKTFFDYEDVFDQKLYELNNLKNFKFKQAKQVLKIEKIKKFSSIFNTLARKNKNKFYAQTVRDAKFLNWRYVSRPDNKYYNFQINDLSSKKVIGFFVCKLYRYQKKLFGHIIDYYIVSKEIKKYNESILQAINFLKNKKVKYISTDKIVFDM